MKPKKTFILEARAVIRAKDSMEATDMAMLRMREVNDKMTGWHFYEYAVKESE